MVAEVIRIETMTTLNFSIQPVVMRT